MAADYILFLGIVVGGLFVALLPFLIAFLAARLGALPRRLAFAVVCTLLTYGATVAALVAQSPLLAASTHLAPTWASLGYPALADAVIHAAEYLGYVTVLVPLALMFIWPLWLGARWPALVLAWDADNSSRPAASRVRFI